MQKTDHVKERQQRCIDNDAVNLLRYSSSVG